MKDLVEYGKMVDEIILNENLEHTEYLEYSKRCENDWDFLINQMPGYRKKSKLVNYLENLDFDDIKVLQALMRIGKDGFSLFCEYYWSYGKRNEDLTFYNEVDEEEEEKYKIHIPIHDGAAYLKWYTFRCLEKGKGWKTKEIEIEQILEHRFRLDEYLRKACEIIGI